ncbi:NAD(P)-binding protein, partial [Pyrenochaeta sp. DS3sAY3a]
MSTPTARPKTAYITGGASGIGRALATRLLSKGWHVFIADRDAVSAESFAAEYNGSSTSANATIHHAYCDTASWASQLSSFQKALHVLGGRIDFVAPIAGIGEKKWLPLPAEMAKTPADSFVEPDLSVVNIDLTGVLYTIALAVQHFRRQDPVKWSPEHEDSLCRGKIGLVASICGIYCVPSLPIYTAAKHALVGLTRSYGALLREEGITVNAVAPNVVRTSISSDNFYQALETEGLLTPMEGLMSAFDEIITRAGSGEVYECGPKNSWTKRLGVEYL